MRQYTLTLVAGVGASLDFMGRPCAHIGDEAILDHRCRAISRELTILRQ